MLELGPSPSLPCLAFKAPRWPRRVPPSPTSLTSNIGGSWAGGWEEREERGEREEREEGEASEERE